MKVNRIRQNVLPLLAAFIWGTAFVAQSMAAGHVGPFTFNAARSVIAFFFLLGLCVIRRIWQSKAGMTPASTPKALMIGGICCGTALAVASNLQQKGIETTTSGKAGFITALYIVLVPIAGLFLKRRVGIKVWAGVALAMAGLYCLCITEGFSIAVGDFYLLGCAVCFTVQIMCIDHFAQKVDGVELSCAQFFVVSIISTVGMFLTETPTMEAVSTCLWPILYVGVFSSGVAYTLQVIGQKNFNPTIAAMIMSMESVISALASYYAYSMGWLEQDQSMTVIQILGCVIMFCSVIFVQLPFDKLHKH